MADDLAAVKVEVDKMRYLVQEQQELLAQRDNEVKAYRERVEAIAEEMAKVKLRNEQTCHSVGLLREDHETTRALTDKAHGWLEEVDASGKHAHSRNSDL